MHEHKPEFATILAFDVNVTKEGGQTAKELNVKIFTAEIIYHLFDKFTAYMADVRKQQQEKAALTAVFPCVAEISSPEHVWVPRRRRRPHPGGHDGQGGRPQARHAALRREAWADRQGDRPAGLPRTYPGT